MEYRKMTNIFDVIDNELERIRNLMGAKICDFEVLNLNVQRLYNMLEASISYGAEIEITEEYEEG
jgi:hypothetical protein